MVSQEIHSIKCLVNLLKICLRFFSKKSSRNYLKYSHGNSWNKPTGNFWNSRSGRFSFQDCDWQSPIDFSYNGKSLENFQRFFFKNSYILFRFFKIRREILQNFSNLFSLGEYPPENTRKISPNIFPRYTPKTSRKSFKN